MSLKGIGTLFLVVEHTICELLTPRPAHYMPLHAAFPQSLDGPTTVHEAWNLDQNSVSWPPDCGVRRRRVARPLADHCIWL